MRQPENDDDIDEDWYENNPFPTPEEQAFKYRLTEDNIIKEHETTITVVAYVEGMKLLISADTSGMIIARIFVSPYEVEEISRLNLTSFSAVVSIFPTFYNNTGYL